MTIKAVEWADQGIILLDQRRLPEEEVYLTLESPQAVIAAIRDLVVRGAPAIGVTAALGLALGARELTTRPEGFRIEFDELCEQMNAARPTAVNLGWAVERMQQVVEQSLAEGVEVTLQRLESEARHMHREDAAINRAIGRHGAALLAERARILTHCNAGALATAGYGTALGVVRAAVEAGKQIRVLAGETRPFLQGARLTTWELQHDGIDCELITDNMSAYVMQRGEVDVVIVGADRVAANGDVANKIGTYGLAVLAREHGIPFYVAAPTSTVDLTLSGGEQIPIEQRSGDEVVIINEGRIAPYGIQARYPAFDVTPHRLVTAIITEAGVARRPYIEELKRLCVAARGMDLEL